MYLGIHLAWNKLVFYAGHCARFNITLYYCIYYEANQLLHYR